MAFVTAVSGQTVMGDLRVVYGTFTNGTNDGGGAITTGLNTVLFYILNITSHADSAPPKVTNSSGTLTIVTPDGTDGTWVAFGK